MSHPVWVRGLKLWPLHETLTDTTSHPVWVRGLKQFRKIKEYLAGSSHPVWVRGLKRIRWREMHASTRRTPCGCVD